MSRGILKCCADLTATLRKTPAHLHLHCSAPEHDAGEVNLGILRPRPRWKPNPEGLEAILHPKAQPLANSDGGDGRRATRFRCPKRLPAVHAHTVCLPSLALFAGYGRSLMSALTIKPSGLPVSLCACLVYGRATRRLSLGSVRRSTHPRAPVCATWDQGPRVSLQFLCA